MFKIIHIAGGSSSPILRSPPSGKVIKNGFAFLYASVRKACLKSVTGPMKSDIIYIELIKR